MHELALSQEILETVRPYVGAGRRLEKVVVECGVFSGVEPDCLDYCFCVVARHMGFEGALLEVRVISSEALCPLCRTETSVSSMWAKCPGCGHSPLTIKGGGELKVASIDLKED